LGKSLIIAGCWLDRWDELKNVFTSVPCCVNVCEEAIFVVVGGGGRGGDCEPLGLEVHPTPVASSRAPRPCLSLGESPLPCSRMGCDSGEDRGNGGICCCTPPGDFLGSTRVSGPNIPAIDSISLGS